MSAELICFLVIVGIAVWALSAKSFFDSVDRKSRTIEPMDRDKALDYVIKNLWEKDGDR